MNQAYEAAKGHIENARMVQRGAWTYSGQRDWHTDDYYILHCNLGKNCGAVEKITGPHTHDEFQALMTGFMGIGQ